MQTGLVPEGGRQGYTPLLGNPSLPVGEKLTIRRGIFTDDNTFMYCQNWVLVIDLAKKDNRLISSCRIEN